MALHSALTKPDPSYSTSYRHTTPRKPTCTGWASDRAEAGIEPEIQVQPFGNLRTALAEAGRFDAYILDGRPHSSEQTIEIGRAAHVIVIPTGQTKDDLRPAVQLAHSLVDAGIDPSRIVFALVKTTRSTAVSTVASERRNLDRSSTTTCRASGLGIVR